MAGRRAQPVEWHVVGGNKSHLTKGEIKCRRLGEASAKSGNKRLTANRSVSEKPVAAAMFKKLKGLYNKMDCIDALDENAINRYCLMCAEASDLEAALENIGRLIAELEDVPDEADKVVRLYNSLGNISRALNGKREMLLKLEDRLFLNPVARVRNVPKSEPVKKVDRNADLFG